MTVHVLYENEDWMPPVRRALAARGLAVEEHFTAGGSIDLQGRVLDGVVLNRMSPSSPFTDEKSILPSGVKFGSALRSAVPWWMDLPSFHQGSKRWIWSSGVLLGCQCARYSSEPSPMFRETVAI